MPSSTPLPPVRLLCLQIGWLGDCFHPSQVPLITAWYKLRCIHQLGHVSDNVWTLSCSFLNLRLSRLVNQYNAVQLTEADADLSINWLHLDITCRIYSHFYARTGQLYFCYVVVQLIHFWASLVLCTGVPEVSCVKGHLVGLLDVLSIYGFSPYWHGVALFKLH